MCVNRHEDFNLDNLESHIPPLATTTLPRDFYLGDTYHTSCTPLGNSEKIVGTSSKASSNFPIQSRL